MDQNEEILAAAIARAAFAIAAPTHTSMHVDKVLLL
jgi:hypothetical protein